MFKTTRKKRPPYAQLKEAHDIAKGMLISRGIVSSKSIFEKLANKPGAPILPGIVPYLPDRWTLDEARQIVMVITREWVKENNGDSEKQEQIQPFFRFAIRKMEDEERKWRSKVRKEKLEDREMETISSIFSNLRRMETCAALKTFLVDSFAVSVIVKTNGSVSDYLTWFIEDWTFKLNELWKKQDKEKD